jgi:hypothetical protein
MKVILYLAIRGLRNKKGSVLLLFLVSLIAMLTILSAITNAASAVYQQKSFADYLGYDMEKVLHLDYRQTEEDPSFAAVLQQYRQYIAGLPGVQAVGQFDAAGVYFSELKSWQPYLEINSRMVADGKYAGYPGITQLLCVDESLLPLVKGGIQEYGETAAGHLPVYASEVFAQILPVGTLLTDERTGEIYEVAGFFPKNSQWVAEDDLIRFPMVSLNGWLIAPFSEESQKDVMTQLSCLHNTYVLLTEDADAAAVQRAISDYPAQHGFEASANLLSEEYSQYCEETKTFSVRQAALAIFIAVMATTSMISVFAADCLLKKRQYGTLIANGCTLSDIALCMGAEIALIILPAALLAWICKLVEFERSTDLFRGVLLSVHIHDALPLCLGISAMLVAAATAIPSVRILHYQPSTLIGGDINGSD